MIPSHDGFLRHIAACNNARLPGDRLPLLVDGQHAGWVLPVVAARLGGTSVAGVDLPAIGQDLAAAGFCGWRDEPFDVRASEDGAVLGTVDRGALPLLGVEAVGVHLNGLVQRGDGPHLWIARRAEDKKLDPGKLDHIVAGGVSAGLGPLETLAKEAAEEAGMPAELVAQAVPREAIRYTMERAEGLRRDRLHCFDVTLPEDFVPRPVDGEVSAFEMWPIQRVYETVRETDYFKFNVNLVLIGLFVRLGMVEDAALVNALYRVTPSPRQREGDASR